MTFNSYTFLAFFAVVLALYNHAGFTWQSRKLILIVASYVFYAAWSPPFVLLLVFSTIVDWNLGKQIYKADTIAKKKFFIALSLGVNLGLLAYFKYSNFFLDSFSSLLGSIGVQYQAPNLDIILPVGISYYTFQTLSYSLDIYRGHMKPWHSFTDYALFVTFFPQLVAGPIVRASDFLPQTTLEKKVTTKQLNWGITLMIVGLFQKVALADGIFAPVVDSVFGSASQVNGFSAYMGTLAFAGQIFCDFAGYSTIAIGAAMCLGFALPDNFKSPYVAIGFSDFWRRWHISLSTWLRDYLYISLGGNRHGTLISYRNLMLTMLIGGLWHGASWAFVVWGALHGSYLVLERLLSNRFGHWKIWSSLPGKIFLAAMTFALVCYAWVFFRADTFTRAYEMSGSLFFLANGGANVVALSSAAYVLAVMAGLLSIQWLLRDTSLEAVAQKIPNVVIAMVLGLLLTCIALSSGENRAFIYFQF